MYILLPAVFCIGSFASYWLHGHNGALVMHCMTSALPVWANKYTCRESYQGLIWRACSEEICACHHLPGAVVTNRSGTIIR